VRSVAYVVGLATLVLLDAVEKKSRNFILAAGTAYSLLTLYHVLIRIFSMEEENKILMVIYGKNIYIRSMKRSIFSNSFILMLKGLKTLYKDKKQEFLMFCTRHVLLKDEIQSQGDNNDNDEASELAFRNMQLYEKIGHGVLLILTLAFITTFLTREYEKSLIVGAIYILEMCGIIVTSYTIMHNEFSMRRFKRLYREISVVLVFCCLILIFLIDIYSVQQPMDIISSFGYVTCGMILLLLDAMKRKHRALILVTGSIFVFVNIFNVYNRIFGTAELGLILIQPFGQTVYVRSVKRTLFFSVFGLSLKGIIALYCDQKQERYMFIVDHIFRETGEVSKIRHSEKYVARRMMSLDSRTE
jgi:uncharacterized membrane protein YecN with MAPEG domain